MNGTCMAWDPQIMEDRRSSQDRGWNGPVGGFFLELAVVAVMVMTMSLVVVAVVFVVSVKGSHGVVDDEGRARACANGGGDRSRVVMWAGDEVENQEVAWRGPGTAGGMWAGHAAGGRWAALEGRADETSVYDSSVR